ncbi:MAG: hypothetical protein A2806_03625 [Candidatus Terrybacteria bacterium RIFCSPHIGHO2_01_FULL_48_17]|uniref:Uncharacterized protein n=1 Tax=Candidatus Terrybacteria bacterium RIFCSPHIGHO2_01_FULL_48_17 TaxID=1802362 RepID=A0A1G2PH54_9BACT|nr:MAG: hypothetical protein A2806_03625 [Candidatus Terrybacteria bacterium RIFCSPHIGHO2_01_FULL_48_17]OHA53089.1 MAG: hypothetical protein A3A30_01835 [Candidatus Terrybacteria bacterium RIFCSPLOWO2_01_FULL_48_14]
MAPALPEFKIPIEPRSAVVTIANSPLLVAVLVAVLTLTASLALWFLGASSLSEPIKEARTPSFASELDVRAINRPLFQRLTPFGLRPEVFVPPSRDIFIFPQTPTPPSQ